MIPFPQIDTFNNFNKLVSRVGDTIYIQVHKLGYSFDYYYDELLFDLFSTYYAGQKIVIVASDGENLVRRGVVNFFDDLCNKGIVLRDSVTFVSHELHWDLNFKHEKLSYGPWFTQLNEYINSVGNFNSVNHDAKFVGCLISRFTPTRFKLAYQLDQGFPDDNFLTFRGNIDSIKEFYSTIDLDNTYRDQVDWISNKQFDIDESIDNTGFLSWMTSCQSYHNLWPKYLIECVAETDTFSNSFLTEKTARCIVSAKPFVIVAGKDSLKTLRTFGFQTYGSVIDESYDLETTTNARINSIIRSLTELYHSPDRLLKIAQLNEIAKYNQQIYDQIRRKI